MRDTLDAYAAKLPKWGLAAALHRRKELGDEGTRNDARRARRSDGDAGLAKVTQCATARCR